MKVIILCGGRGARLQDEAQYRPKPMLPIGNRPILWHIMKSYAHYGHKEFILCLGFKGDMIREYFRNYLWNICDTSLRLGREPEMQFHTRHGEEDWTITLAETGEDSKNGYRIRLAEKYLGEDKTFLLAYGDCVGDVDINSSIAFHEKSGRICTMTAVHPPARFSQLDFDESGRSLGFNKRPQVVGDYINGGYMVCDRRLLEYLPDDPSTVLEEGPVDRLTSEGQLSVFQHEGFWQPVDTFQELALLETLWEQGKAPWKVW
jgi:glucose-1-phosphate cytidylyltransferase